MSATWRKGAQLKRRRLWKPSHTGLIHDADVSFCLVSWCLSWRSWCAAALTFWKENNLWTLFIYQIPDSKFHLPCILDKVKGPTSKSNVNKHSDQFAFLWIRHLTSIQEPCRYYSTYAILWKTIPYKVQCHIYSSHCFKSEQSNYSSLLTDRVGVVSESLRVPFSALTDFSRLLLPTKFLLLFRGYFTIQLRGD
jgi:hypothetical protein